MGFSGIFQLGKGLSRQKMASWRVRNLIMLSIVACHLVMRFAGIVHSSLSSSALIRIWASCCYALHTC